MLAALAGVLGCRAGEPPLVNPGVSDVRPEVGKPRSSGSDAGAPWERAGEMGAYRAMSTRPFPSQGHFAGRWNGELFANPTAAAGYAALTPSSMLPEGAVLVEKLSDAKTGAAGPLFAMEKRGTGYFPTGGDWKYVVVDSAGWVEDQGQLPLCARCHAEAAADFVFRIPEPSPSPGPAP
jgi:hypothetical protein